MKEDIPLQGPCPVLILRDFNGDIENFPTLSHELLKEGFTDLGAIASRWGGINNAYTCKAHNATMGSVRDYIIINSFALPLVVFSKLSKELTSTSINL